MTAAELARKARAIAHVRAHFPHAILVIGPPGAVILMDPLTLRGIFYHDTARDGPPHMAWARMSRSMKIAGIA